MKRKLASIVRNLTGEEIHELIRIRKINDKKVVALRKKRDKIAGQLAAVEAELARLGDAAEPGKGGRRGRKPGPKKGATRGRRTNLSAAVRQVFAAAGTPLRASQVVDGLPTEGMKIKDVADMRKRVSVVLASQKNHFEQIERGVYRLKESVEKKDAVKKRPGRKASPKKAAAKKEAARQ